ncbi:hypothetical protein JOF42_002422 [Microbacterium phyllosphaerae]|uniref:Uncharacterized protein n=1 Tax=Microbacterium phyllosphaerae TaxID=124798 RepID=A0ABS4WRT5_9MICO|nr:hypothetical protein [Microbacterium phyllosphaerae]MBP2378927.1 hypothetical protein [Microbacterium phyllosphaerae]
MLITLGVISMDDAAALAQSRQGHVLALVAVGAGIAATLLCSLLGIGSDITGVIVSATAGIPAVIGLVGTRARRDRSADLRRLQHGELRRPVSSVVLLLAVSILAVDSALGVLIVAIVPPDAPAGVGWLVVLAIFVASFLMATYASHYLGPRPYAMASVAVLGMVAARVVILVVTLSSIGAPDAIPFYLEGLVLHVFTLGAVLLGVFVGRRRHTRFVAEKAARLESEIRLDAPSDARTQEPPRARTRIPRSRLRSASLGAPLRRRRRGRNESG